LPAEQLSEKISRRYVHGEKGMLVRFELKKGAVIPLHQHPNEQITYILTRVAKNALKLFLSEPTT
jgi:quercetin dioxygenase-like cupin family protein